MDRKKNLFWFKEIWLLDKGCMDRVEAVWLSHGFEHSNSRVIKKIEKCGVELTRWAMRNLEGEKDVGHEEEITS